MTDADKALIELGRLLRSLEYEFTTITPESHERVLEREIPAEIDEREFLRQFFGWNRAVLSSRLHPEILSYLKNAALVETFGDRIRSLVRFSTLDEILVLHSRFPTSDENSVFLGPDTYRFVRFLKHAVVTANQIVEIGCGSGAAAFSLARWLKKSTGHSPKLILSDVNPTALRFSRINAAINNFDDIEFIESNSFDRIPKGADVAISNPPFIIDTEARTYRHGGGRFGLDVSLQIVSDSLRYFDRGGILAMYTGSCVVSGEDQFLKHLNTVFSGRSFRYEEIDPDIFGEQLCEKGYEQVDRLAAVGLTLTV